MIEYYSMEDGKLTPILKVAITKENKELVTKKAGRVEIYSKARKEGDPDGYYRCSCPSITQSYTTGRGKNKRSGVRPAFWDDGKK